jgi:hypothetical protein
MKKVISSLVLFCGFSLTKAQEIKTKFDDAIPVLNLGTFHMGYTPDANSTEFDEHNQDNIRQVHKIAAAIAAFKPTVIVVETTPQYNMTLQKEYAAYLKNPKMKLEKPSEIELLAYEVGRLSGTQRIYGIDYKENYNYAIGHQIKDGKDTETYMRYMQALDLFDKQYPEDQMTVLEIIKRTNTPLVLDALMNVNADMLTHISTEGQSEGADEAAKFYHRNLVMYSNLNQLELTKDDRVFILMGATHTAFFNMWLQRSPKYQLVPVFDYLK